MSQDLRDRLRRLRLEAPPGLAQRAVRVADDPGRARPRGWQVAGAVVAVALAILAAIMVTATTSAPALFSNISAGLGT
jgi:hypothetical protein